MREKRKISFPTIGRYNPAVRYFIENGLEQEYIRPPKMTQNTIDIGCKYSPDTVCMPFKTTLGNMIETLETGCDTMVMIPGVCRLAYYGELHERILKDLGYEFDYVNISKVYNTQKKRNYLKLLKHLNPKVNYVKCAIAAIEAFKMVDYIDEIVALYYQNMGFEIEKGSYKKVLDRFMLDMYSAGNRKHVKTGYMRAKEGFAGIPLNKSAHPIRVGIVGEFYTVQDEFSNLELERKLAEMGVEVHRWMNVSHRILHYSGEKNLHIHIKDYCKYEMGPTSTANIWCAKDYAQRGFDGIIHIKSAGCTPEIDIMPVLQNIGKDYKIPILYLTYDSQTGDEGLLTRIEAFYDMLQMRNSG